MKFTGAFYNPDYNGEGIDSIEYVDGEIIAHFFSYTTSGQQLWLVCVGKRVGNVASLDAWYTEGGKIGDQAALKNVAEIAWGKIILTEQDSNTMTVSFQPLTGSPWDYNVVPLHVAITSGTVIKAE